MNAAWPETKVAVLFSHSGIPRKHNYATSRGWRLLYFTWDEIKSGVAESLLERVFETE